MPAARVLLSVAMFVFDISFCGSFLITNGAGLEEERLTRGESDKGACVLV